MRAINDTTLWLILLCTVLSVCSFGCARQKTVRSTQPVVMQEQSPEAGSASAVPGPDKQTRSMTPFEELVFSLVSDAVDLLPEHAGKKLSDAMIKGIEMPEHNVTIDDDMLYSRKKEEIASVAGLIVQYLYDDNNLGSELIIPQTIIFVHKKRIGFNEILTEKTTLLTSENRAVDTYNTCLNLLVSVLSANYGITEKRAEGIYHRDSMNNLNFHKAMKIPETR